MTKPFTYSLEAFTCLLLYRRGKLLAKQLPLFLSAALLLLGLFGSSTANAQITNGYCKPTLGSCCEWISKVNFNTINNTTINEEGYADYTNISTTVAKGQTIPISVTVSTNSTYTEYVTIYFDWNRDYIFESEIKLGGQSIKGQATFTGSVTVPAGAPDGCSLMRVFMQYASAPNGACSIGDGEVEDYTVLVNKPAAVPVAAFTSPTGLTCSQSAIQFTNNSTISDNSTMFYTWNFGDNTTSTEANPTKTYSAAGTYIVTLTAKTYCSSQTTSHAITVNPTPLAPVITAVSNDTGDNTADNTTEDNTLLISGTATANANIALTKAGTGQIGTATADANGNWTVDYTQVELAVGTHTFTATATNSNGCTSPASTNFTVIIQVPTDKEPPVVPAAPALTAGINGNTNHNKPTINGTAEANSNVDIYLNGIKTGTVKASNNGTWNYTFVNALAEGAHTVNVTATDAAGNASGQSQGLTFMVDTMPPIQPATPVLAGGTNGTISNNMPTLTGTAEANAAVKIYNGSNLINTVLADANGNWSYTFETTLTEGPHAIKVNATDATANTSAFSNTLTINVDTQAPAIPANFSLTASSDTGLSSSDNITNNAKPTFAGSAEPGATVTLFAGTTEIGTAIADQNGNWQLAINTTLPDGNHSFTVNATDAVGNKSAASNPLAITIKTTAPTAPANLNLAAGNDTGADQNDQVTNNNQPVFSGTAAPGVIIKLFAGTIEVGAALVDETGNWQVATTTGLADGNYNFTVTATDVAGNISQVSSPLSVTIDKTPPVGSLAINNNAAVTKNNAIMLAISPGDATEISFSNNNSNWGLWEPAATTKDWELPSGDGLKTVYLQMRDHAGNIAAPVFASIALDQTAPVVNNVTVDGIYNTNRNITFNEGTATLNNTPFTSGSAVSSDGIYTLVVTDAASNTTTVTFTIDKIAPVVTGVTNNGIYNTNVTVSFNEGNATLNNVAFANETTITAEGQHTLVITDAAGNATTVHFITDKTAPTGTLAMHNNATVTNHTNISLALTATDGAGIGSIEMRFSDNEANWTTWETVTATKSWTLPSGDGNKTVYLQLRDNAGNSSATIPVVIALDQTKPTVTVSTPASNPTNAAFTVTFNFSEEATNFSPEKITVINGNATDFKAESSSVYTATVTPIANGEVTVEVKADKIQDIASNGNVASAALTRLFDNIAPAGYTAQLNQNRIDVSNVDKATVTIASAEIGTAYFYTITSENGGTPVTGTATIPTAQSTVNLNDLSNLNDGKLIFTFYLQDAAGNKGQEISAEVMKYTRDIVAVQIPALLQAPIRTKFEQLPLPVKVEVTYSSGAKEEIDVTWAPGLYNGTIAGSYELMGTLTLAAGTTNLSNMQATMTVEVQPNKVPTALALSSTTFSPNIASTEVIGTFNTTDADDTEHVYALVNGQGATHNSLFQIVGDKLYLKSNTGLSGQTQFSIRVSTTDPYHNTIEQDIKLTKSAYAKAVNELKIVNAFTPNGDGVNDEWTVPELKFYNKISVEVFDRSGVRLFHTTNPEKGWDGKDQHGQVLKGAYLYVIQVEDIKLTKKGVITVVKK